MNQEDINQKLIELSKTQSFAVLATDHHGHPYTNLVAFALTKDSQSVLFATQTTTQKFKNISQNPKISLLIDNRENTSKDLQEAVTISILGTAIQIDKTINKYSKIFLDKHPNLTSFLQLKNSTLIKIDIETVMLVHNFQDVHVITLKK
jgi:general stress protein 26